jgi:hypothetical protein
VLRSLGLDILLRILLSKTFTVRYLEFRGEGSRGYPLFWDMALGRCIIGTRHVETAYLSFKGQHPSFSSSDIRPLKMRPLCDSTPRARFTLCHGTTSLKTSDLTFNIGSYLKARNQTLQPGKFTAFMNAI